MNIFRNRNLIVITCSLAFIANANTAFSSPILYGNSVIYGAMGTPFYNSANEIGYAVYDRSLGTKSDPWGTGVDSIQNWFTFSGGTTQNPSLDLTAKYLYLYQIINSTSGPVINMADIPTHPDSDISSFGSFGTDTYTKGLVFSKPDGSGTVTDPPTILDINHLAYVIPYNPMVSLVNDRLIAKISVTSGDSASYIFGFTSNFSPRSDTEDASSDVDRHVYVYTPLSNGSSFKAIAPGVVSNIPEPETLSLILLGVMSLALSRTKKQPNNKPA